MKTVTYSRVSTSHHEQKPEIQVNELRRFCGGRDWLISEEIVDHGFSGSTDQRPGLKRLMVLARTKEIEVIVVVKLDRLFRSLKHLVATLEEFEHLGIKFVAVKDNVDYSTPSGRLFVQILGSLGEFERSLLRERTMAGIEHARSQGKKFGRPRKHDHSEIVRLHHSGQTYRQIKKATGAPTGSIARAIKTARKSPQESPLDTSRASRLKPTVLRANETTVRNQDPSDKRVKTSGDEDSSL